MQQSWIGKKIGGRYQIDSLLGQGGMSAVYSGYDPNLRRKVAIKLIHPHLSENPNFVGRFKEEAAAVARLRHPNIVQVHDFDVDGETYYMVMEYLIGETLADRVRRLNAENRNMPFAQAIRICRQMCEALGYAHSHELVHRDIKPANIMLNVNAQAILMDFGIVKIIGGEYHTATGATLGTATYMSPEQIRGERADERSDIYSLGVTLFEMLAGRAPYQADSVVTLMMKVIEDPLPDIRELRKRIPERLALVVEKALKKQPKHRFQTMEGLAAGLREAEEAAARTEPLETRVDSVSTFQPRDTEPIARDEGTEVDTLEDAAGIPSPPEVRIPQPQEDIPRREADPSTAVPTTKEMREAAGDPPKMPALAKVAQIARGNARRILIILLGVLLLTAVVVLGFTFLTSRETPGVEIEPFNLPSAPINLETAQLPVSLGNWESDSFIQSLTYSPNGALIATANNRDQARLSEYRYYAAIWRVEGAALERYLLGPQQWVNDVAFSPDGRFLAAASDEDRIFLWQVSDGTLVREIEASLGGVSSLDFSPSNLLLAAGGWGTNVGLFQVSDGHMLRTLEGHEDSVKDVDFSPDGTLLASASDDSMVRLWQVSDGRLLHTLRAHTAGVRKVVFSPDGSWLASASDDHSIRVWEVRDGTLARSLEADVEPILDITFSNDGTLLASCAQDGKLRLWQMSSGEMLRELTEYEDTITSLDFSPDGTLLVFSGADGALQFWGLSEAMPFAPETPEP
jgi:serine/threonine protein kinase/WD40 repeat protein